MLRVGKGIHETDSNRLHSFLLKKGHLIEDISFLHWLNHIPLIIDPLINRKAKIALDKGLNILITIVILLLPDSPTHLQCVPHSLRRQESCLGPCIGQDGVGRHRRPVHNNRDIL